MRPRRGDRVRVVTACVALATACTSCDRREPITACTDDLAGVYEVETTATEREPTRWHVLDHRRSIEAYPLFDDTAGAAAPTGPTDVAVAPRVIELARAADALAGSVSRRYMQGARRCDAKATARLTACSGDTLELVLGEPVPPIAFEPCTWGQAGASRRERWRRVLR